MAKSLINRLVEGFLNAFVQLHIQIPVYKIEHLATLVHHSMDGEKRNFHTSRHALSVSEGQDGVPTLAGLFHDIIYFQIDNGFPMYTHEMLLPFVEIDGDEVFIKPEFDIEDILFTFCLEIFEFQPGQKLSPFSGLNEFLSAFVAAKSLEEFLTRKQLLMIIACIEATIPFRMPDKRGISAYDRLEMRLRRISIQYDVDFSEHEISQTVRWGVTLANKDVENFAYQDVGEFLDHTWALLPETNGTLWATEVYSIRNYRQALLKMENFLSFLNPDSVFQQYKDTPDNKFYHDLNQQAHYNIDIARDYLGIKLLNIAIIEALALTTGGDVPISMFLGDIRHAGQKVERAEDYLPKTGLNDDLEYNEVLYALLEFGRAHESSFDMKNSPLASFVYKSLGTQKTNDYLDSAKDMFAHRISPEDFLRKIEAHVVCSIAKACAMLAFTRREALLDQYGQIEDLMER